MHAATEEKDAAAGVELTVQKDKGGAEDFTPMMKQEPTAEEAWPLWKLVLLALPQLGVQVLWCFIGPNSAPYMLHLGMGHALATLNNVAGPITGFFTGPIVGAVSDNLTSKWGRRRPVIFAGLVSTCVAGTLFAASEHLMPKGSAVYFAAPMYWILDVTINILQTPYRALVSDLATEEQQLPMQVVFVFMMSIGNFVAFSIMKIYPVPVHHMLELMVGICLLNIVLVGIQFVIAREKPLLKDPNAPRQSACAPVMSVVTAVKDSPRLLYHLAVVQTFVWVGNTAWNLYAGQWMSNSVYEGSVEAAPGTAEHEAYAKGQAAFSDAGQAKSVLQLVSALVIIALLVKTSVRPRTVYSPCIFIGAVTSIMAATVVGHNATLGIACMALSIMPETGSFAIPFGLVATLNKRAEQEGKKVSTALQMSLLNCCITVGQQICTVSLAAIEGKLTLSQALPLAFAVAAVAQIIASIGAAFLDDRPVSDGDSSEEDSTTEESDFASDA